MKAKILSAFTSAVLAAALLSPVPISATEKLTAADITSAEHMSRRNKNETVGIQVGTAETDENGEALILVTISGNNGIAGFRFGIDYRRRCLF